VSVLMFLLVMIDDSLLKVTVAAIMRLCILVVHFPSDVNK
jgi:hypothetical protein